MEKNIKNIKKEFKEYGIFYTSTELAEMLKRYVDYEPTRIYDPTCGQGNLLSVFDDHIEKYGQEIYADELEKAGNRLKNFHGYCGDTLKDDGFKGMTFDLIVANPPFSVKWEPNETDERFAVAPCTAPPGKADYAFLLHILHHLADEGKAICLEFPGILYRGQREGRIRQWLIEKNYIERVVAVPGKTFVDTQIATCIVILNKSKVTTDIVFEDLELGKELTVTREQVESNGYALSVSNYIIDDTPQEQVDPYKLMTEARHSFLKKMEGELKFEQTVCEMEGTTMQPFIEQIKEVLRRFEQHGEEETL